MRNIKEINIKTRPYNFFHDMIDIKNFDLNLLNIDKISIKSAESFIYNVRYITLRSLDHANIDGKNLLYLIFNKIGKLSSNQIIIYLFIKY